MTYNPDDWQVGDHALLSHPHARRIWDREPCMLVLRGPGPGDYGGQLHWWSATKGFIRHDNSGITDAERMLLVTPDVANWGRTQQAQAVWPTPPTLPNFGFLAS
jgi:hypothetical protein